MGCSVSKLSPHEEALRALDKKMAAELLVEKEIQDKKIILLLLGAGESGKSTIFKQMKVLYGNQYNEMELLQNSPAIYSNIMIAIKLLCEQVVEMGFRDEILEADTADFELLINVDGSEVVNREIGEAIKNLWVSKTILKVWDRRHEFQVIDSVCYYFNNIERISQKNYVPTVDDVLHARVRTSGIVTESYTVDHIPFEMYDVGGQRNERKKWIHCFEGVTAVIFVAALSEYDQTLYEDTSTNRMMEALDLFADICNNVFFLSSSMILFLNKSDLFREKIKTKHIKDSPHFVDYDGEEGDYEAGVAYFKEKFLARNKAGSNKKIYVHVTCATDSKNVRYVFDSCKDILLRNSIKETGFDF